MAKLLFKLGHWAGGNSKKVIGSVFLLLSILAGIALSMGMAFDDDISMPGTESKDAMEVMEKEFSSGREGGQAYIVMKADNNESLSSAKYTTAMDEMLNEIKKDEAVTAVATPEELDNINTEEQIGYATVTYDSAAENVTQKSKDNVEDNLSIVRDAGLEAGLGGSVEFEATEAGGGAGEIIGVALAYVILAVTFASLVIAGMPIITALISLGSGILLIIIGTNFFAISSVSLSLAGMLGLAVGIDYALFIFSRFKQQLRKGSSVQESIAIANGTAGNAVVFAGVTVIIALLGLSVVNIPFITAMGIATAVVVLFSIIVAILVVPAILGLVGHRMKAEKNNRFILKLTRANKKNQANTNKWGKFVTKHPVMVAVVGIATLIIMAVPFFHLNIGLPNDGNKPYEFAEREGYDLLTEGYGEGFHSTLVAIADPSNNAEASSETVNSLSEEVGQLDGVKSVTPAQPNDTGELYLMNVTPENGPNDPKTKKVVEEIRELSGEDNVDLMVTGSTAINIDVTKQIMDSLPMFAALIVLFAFLLMMIVFRSILVPLKAVLGFVLSIGATLGFTVFVVQDGNLIDLFGFPGSSAILFLLPVLCIGILFGLSMDYEVFLVSRMREEFVKTGDSKKAVLAGMKESGPVVTAAGLIMISVFSGFIFTQDPIIKQMGLTLAFGVLFDAFIVRMMIVPAVMTLMGNASWYFPKWLDKLLPNFDVEGETLKEEVDNKSNNRKVS
ncbi:MMPL family transporter [Marinococcus sp. PL1-022]|uniref:MMPL family transporter n=1 Tax=Marinococcus sp. PL1-022 TaxID=3095363 RepID=UPI0029C14300|nr:MMPL family transporter [Marinococcus sp. PL1-022]MDX6152700.1 MMPL family transporter [Marinococcus sp. PL1-022]